MSDTNYDKEWDTEDEEPRASAEQVRADALLTLATEAMVFTNESIRDRNATTFSSEIKRAHKLYNATTIDNAEDLLENFEGSRTAIKDGSKVVQNLIRPLTNDGASQLGDMLFPTDTDNWGAKALYPSRPPMTLQHQPATLPSGKPLLTEEGEPITHLQAWEAGKLQIKHKTGRMKDKIKQVLVRNKYGKIGRQLINDASRTGTCVLKAPYVDHAAARKWAKGSGEVYSLYSDNSPKAAMGVVSVLDFLPEMAAAEIADAAYVSVREWYLPRNLRKLKRSGKYNREALTRLLKQKPRFAGESSEEGKQERLSIMDTALVEKLYQERYEVFETWAEFEVETLRAAGVNNLPEESEEGATITACVIHCEGETLRAFLNPLETGDLPFSVWCWDDDPTSIFGKGIPILAENCQLIYNAAWRMILDHGGLSAVPMVSILKDKVTPAGADKNDYSLRGGKVWEIVSDFFNLPDGSKGKPFEIHDIPIHLDQFFAIMEKAEEDAYKLTGVTRVEKNEAGVDNAPLTLGATQMYQNNASVSRRRQVRDYDDDIIKEALTRVYDFIMQHEPDEEIKVPMEIEPQGSSVLMQREVNTQNLMQLYTITANGAAEGSKGVEMLRAIETGMQFPEGALIETAEETERRRTSEAENPPIPPEVMIQQEELAHTKEKDEAEIEIKYMLATSKAAEAQAMVELASIADERKHYREMIKIEKLSEAEGNKILANLQTQQESTMTKLESTLADIQARRDIAAGSMLSKEAISTPEAEAKLVTAHAKAKEADTREKELDNKVSGVIPEGI